MHTRRKVLVAAVAVLVFMLAGPVADRLAPTGDSAWSAIVPWIIIVAAWAYIGPRLWRDWRVRRNHRADGDVGS